MSVATTMNQIRAAMQDVLELGSGLTVVNSQLSSVEPPLPFVAWKISQDMGSHAPHKTERKYLEDEGNQAKYQLRHFYSITCRVEAYGKNTKSYDTFVRATDICADIKLAASKDEAQDILKAVGASITDISVTTDLSNLLETDYRQRAQFDIDLNVVFSTTEVLDRIDSVNTINGNFS